MNIQKIKIVLRWVVAIVLLFVLIRKIDLTSIVGEFRNIVFGWVLVVFLIRAFALVINTFRWQVLFSCHKARASFWELLKARLVGIMYNNILPSSMGGDMIRTYFISRRVNIAISETFSTVVIEKISGVVALLLYMLIATWFNLGVITETGVASLIIILSVIVGTVIVLLFNKHLFELIITSCSKYDNKFVGRLEKYYSAIYEYRNFSNIIFVSILYSLLVQGTSILVTFAAARSLHIDLSIFDMLLIVPIIGLSNVVPVSIGNWGWRESVYIYILQFYGVAGHLALALALFMRLVGFFVSVFGVIVVLSKQGRLRLSSKISKVSNSNSS